MISIDFENVKEELKPRYYEVPEGASLPMPSDVHYPANFPGDKMKVYGKKQITAPDGSIVIYEKLKSAERFQGWKFEIYFSMAGQTYRCKPTIKLKQRLKDEGMPAAVLAGVGDCAAVMRVLWAIRCGLIETVAAESEAVKSPN